MNSLFIGKENGHQLTATLLAETINWLYEAMLLL